VRVKHQISQRSLALAILLNNYEQRTITPADDLDLLRQYTRQHFIAPGNSDLRKDYAGTTALQLSVWREAFPRRLPA
jgi:hypothetical protein